MQFNTFRLSNKVNKCRCPQFLLSNYDGRRKMLRSIRGGGYNHAKCREVGMSRSCILKDRVLGGKQILKIALGVAELEDEK